MTMASGDHNKINLKIPTTCATENPSNYKTNVLTEYQKLYFRTSDAFWFVELRLSSSSYTNFIQFPVEKAWI